MRYDAVSVPVQAAGEGPSRYMLVNVLAYRAREISAAAEEAGEPLPEKAVSIAIDELSSGKLKTHSV